MKLHYNDKVRIISGFYAGQRGRVSDEKLDYAGHHLYTVILPDLTTAKNINESDLVLINVTKSVPTMKG